MQDNVNRNNIKIKNLENENQKLQKIIDDKNNINKSQSSFGSFDDTKPNLLSYQQQRANFSGFGAVQMNNNNVNQMSNNHMQ